jgi:hypothetical protein
MSNKRKLPPGLSAAQRQPGETWSEAARRAMPGYVTSGAPCDVPSCGKPVTGSRTIVLLSQDDGERLAVLIRLCADCMAMSRADLIGVMPALAALQPGDYAAGPGELTVTGPRAEAVVSRFLDAPVERCPHLRDGAEGIWLASEPAYLRCGRCAYDAADTSVGTDEDATCDYCRLLAPMPEDGTARMFGMNVRLDDVPATLLFGLCPGCYAADKAEAAL